MEETKKPNPIMDSMIQGTLNRQAATDQQRMNMSGQTTPYGSLDYTADPSSPSGYRATQSYSPETKALLDSNIRMATGTSDLGNRAIAGIGDMYSKPLDLTNSGVETRINSLARSQMDPIWNQRDEAFRQRMANMGLSEGSEGFRNASRNLGDERARAYNDMLLRGRSEAVSELLQERNQPLNELASLRSGSQIAQPVGSFGFTQTPQVSLQPVDYMGANNRAYQDEQAQRAATMGGMFGLGGAVAGGLAGGPIGSAIGSKAGQYASQYFSRPR